MNSRTRIPWSLAPCLLALASFADPAPLAPATWDKLPRWYGFNLLEKFNVGKSERFKEEDFRLIAELGFNFVRLPMDYRIWIKDKDWEKIDGAALKDIDEAIQFGERYGVHVLLNFHRAPGYTVAKPAEAKDLWTDPDAQRVCAMHWATFARRYRGIPNSRLSFNLFNEPAHVSPERHAHVVKLVADAIRAEDPARLIICDAREWGNAPSPELVPLKVAQATRGYQPMGVTHYKASWVNGENMPAPAWPIPRVSGFLHHPNADGRQSSLRIDFAQPAAATLRLRVAEVFGSATLLVAADGTPVFGKEFATGPAGQGEWKASKYHDRWKAHQCAYDREYEVSLPPGTRTVTLSNTNGTWISLAAVTIDVAGGQPSTLPLQNDWSAKPVPPIRLDARNATSPFSGMPMTDADTLWEEYVAPFVALRDAGTGVVVGEFGCFNRTPHPIALAWMEDCLKNWRRAGFGWALWNFRGSFGILDSERADVAYEDFRGHKLDRKMLELLLSYRRP